MSQQKTPLGTRVSRWFSNLYYDWLYALWRQDGCAVRELMHGFVNFVKAKKPRKKKGGYRPYLEGLEVRTMPVGVGFIASSYAVTEGELATIAVSLNATPGSTVTVNYASADGTASYLNDYNAVSSALTFNAGPAASFTLQTNTDSLIEGDETVILSLSNPVNASLDLTHQTATLTIHDGTPPTVDFSASSYTVGEGDGSKTVSVTLSGASSSTITVSYATANGTATAGGDYTGTSGFLVFSPGDTSKNFSIPITDDSIDEDDETVVLSLSSPTSATLGSQSTVTLTIQDNDSPPTVEFASSTGSTSESSGVATMSVVLSAASGKTITVPYATSDGTATAGSDYTGATGVLTFNPGDTAKVISFGITNDSIDEYDETVSLVISSPTNATLGSPSTATMTIVDDDDPPRVAFKINPITVSEGVGNAIATVTLTAASGKIVTVQLATSDDTATAPGDYTATVATLTFNAGETSKTASIPIIDDTSEELDESLVLTLSSPSNASLDSILTAPLTIQDNDAPTVAFTSSGYTVGEADGNATITAALTGSSYKTMTVRYATSNGTATAGSDYTGETGTITFNPGDTSKTFTVPITNDTIDEFDETVSLTLSNPTNTTLGSPSLATLTILDNDPPPTLGFTSSSYSVNEAAVTETMSVSLSAASAKTITVAFNTVDGTATTANGDYSPVSGTLTFNPGDTSKTVAVPILDPFWDDGDVTFTVALSNLSNATLGTSPATVTIYDLPVAVDDGSSGSPLSTDENTADTISVLANDSDPNGDALTVTNVTAGAYGTVVINANNTVTYTPAVNYHGADQFTYTINDGFGGSSTATVYVSVAAVNQPPTTTKDNITTDKNSAVVVQVLKNDSDPDNDTLTVTADTNGSHGSVTITDSSTTVTYTPVTDYIGTDSFTYTISDGHSHIATATVNVIVYDHGQWANSVISDTSSWTDSGPYAWYSVQALGKPNTFDYGDDVTAWAPEPEDITSGDSGYTNPQTLAVGFPTADYASGVLVRETYGNGFVTELELLDTSNVYHTVAGVSDTSAPGAPTDFIVNFTQTAYQVKGVRITVDANHDPDAWEEIDAVRLFTPNFDDPVNHAPTLTDATTTMSLDEDTSANVTVSSLASDADSDPLMIEITSDPTNGTAWVDDNGTPDNLSDDFVTYEPDPDYNGSDSFAYTITDINGATAAGVIAVTVNPVNDPPVAEDDFAVGTKNTATVVSVLANDTDVDTGDTLTVSSTTDGAHGSVAITGSGTTVTYTPDTDFTGIDQFNYTMTDGTATSTAQVTVFVYEDGQWATSVIGASSQYDPGDGSTDWAATQATGAPDTFDYGDNATAWAPAAENSGNQTLAVGFTTPAQATGVVIRETNGNGFVTKIELRDHSDGTYHEIWPLSTGQSDPAVAGKATDVVIRFPQTTYDVDAVRITVNTDLDVNDFDEIDAVRLLTASYSGGTTIGAGALNTPPVASDADATTEVNQAVVVHPLDNDYDPDGDAITISAKTNGSHGSVTITDSGSTVTYTPNTDYTGADTFTYTIDDGLGGTVTATVNITVYALGEWANSVASYSSQADGDPYSGYALQALGAPNTFANGDLTTAWSPQYSNDGSQTLTVGFAVPDYAQGVIVRETDGNGFITKIEVEQVSNSSWHTVWDDTDGSADGSPVDFTAAFTETAYTVGAVRITVDTAFNPDEIPEIDAVRLLTATETSPTDTAPTATGSSVTIAENSPTILNVMSGAGDEDGDALTLSIVTDPEQGSVEINDNGTPGDTSDDFLIYTPDPSYSGSDSFTYAVIDVWGKSQTATVNVVVTAVNQSPVTGSDVAYTTGTTPVVVSVLDNDSDPESDTLTVTAVTDGAHGAVSITGSDTTVTYTADDDYSGVDGFTYTISDGHGGTATGYVEVTVYGAATQWASSIVGTSSGATVADSAKGVPDGVSWAPAATPWTPDQTVTSREFITVGFTTHAVATGVLVREPDGAYITQIDLFHDSTFDTIWSGVDPSAGGDFIVTFPETAYNVTAVRVFVDTTLGDGSIDAVGLLTGDAPASTTITSQTSDGAGNATNTTYNSDGQAVAVYAYTQGVLTSTTENTYTSGTLSETLVTDINGNQVDSTFDADGNTLTETDGYGTAGASTTTSTFDDQDRMTSLTDPKGNETTWDYTVADQVTMTDPMGNTEVKHYDSKGNLDYVLDRDDKLTTYEYDSNNNLITEVMYDGPTDAADVEDTLTWTYTPDGKIKTAENGAGTYTFQYNDAGQVVHVDEPFGVSLTMAYDSAGNRILLEDSLGGTETSLYDANNLLVRRTLVQDDVTMRVDFTYDQYGRVLTQTRYSDAAGTELVATTKFTYDAFGNVASIVNTDADNATIDEFDYTFDAGGNLTSETDMQAGIDSGTPWTNDYTFDAQNQLTGDGTNSYDYDAAGNRDTGYTYVQNPDTVHYTNEVASDGVWNYSYDANGNTIKKVAISGGGTWVYGYDNANHLVMAQQWSSDPDVHEDAELELSVTYKYDAFGEQIEEDVADGPTIKYAIDGWNPALPTPVGNENMNVLARLDGSGDLTSRYLYGDQVDQQLGRVDWTGSEYEAFGTLTDHLGSVRDVIDNTGTVKDAITYDSFGNIQSGELDPSFRGWYAWTGKELDQNIDLQYNHARWYDSSTGRWISPDPMGFDAGDSNLYRYVNNRAAEAVDPSGLQGPQSSDDVYNSIRAMFTNSKDNRIQGSASTSINLMWGTGAKVDIKMFDATGQKDNHGAALYQVKMTLTEQKIQPNLSTLAPFIVVNNQAKTLAFGSSWKSPSNNFQLEVTNTFDYSGNFQSVGAKTTLQRIDPSQFQLGANSMKATASMTLTPGVNTSAPAKASVVLDGEMTREQFRRAKLQVNVGATAPDALHGFDNMQFYGQTKINWNNGLGVGVRVTGYPPFGQKSGSVDGIFFMEWLRPPRP